MVLEQEPRPTCSRCLSKKAMPSRKSKHGFQLWYCYCSGCAKEVYKKPIVHSNAIYRKGKKAICEFCGFVPVDSCQLDVDHIDGNHKNHDPTNLQTLCANCHRLKTRRNKDGIHKDKAR